MLRPRRKAILHLGRHLRVDLSLDEAVFFPLPKLVRQHAGRHILDLAPDLIETRCPVSTDMLL